MRISKLQDMMQKVDNKSNVKINEFVTEYQTQ